MIPIEQIKLRIGDCECMTIEVTDLTIEAERDVAGRIFLHDLRINGAPYPRPGGPIDPFDRELAKRIREAIERDHIGYIDDETPSVDDLRETAQVEAHQFMSEVV